MANLLALLCNYPELMPQAEALAAQWSLPLLRERDVTAIDDVAFVLLISPEAMALQQTGRKAPGPYSDASIQLLQAFADQAVIDNTRASASLTVDDDDDRIVVIGPNGQGKTTLVKSIAARLALRLADTAKRSSSASSGRPSTVHRSRNWRSLPSAIMIRPSAQAKS